MSSMVQAVLQHLRQAGPFTVSAISDNVDDNRPEPIEHVAQNVVGIRTSWKGNAELHLHVTIQSGYHINAHECRQASGLLQRP